MMGGSYYSLGGRCFVIVSARKVDRGNNGTDRPWMGFCYGSWLPRVRVSSRQSYCGLSWRWLCFHGEVGVNT